MPFCKYSEENPHNCNDMGYVKCGVAACAIDD